MRRVASIDSLVPVLYLKRISTDEFPMALEAILGPEAKGLSASTIVRLKEVWTAEYQYWSKRSLAGKRYVYIFVDGMYCQARLEDEQSCILVIIGADSLSLYSKAKDMLKNQYLAPTREDPLKACDLGLQALPGGSKWMEKTRLI